MPHREVQAPKGHHIWRVKIIGGATDVIAVSNDGLKAGEDVKDASVTATVVENGKAKKVIVYKYKRKTGYHKKNGHRQQYTKVKIEKING